MIEEKRSEKNIEEKSEERGHVIYTHSLCVTTFQCSALSVNRVTSWIL